MPILESHSYKQFSVAQQVWTIMQDRRGVMYMGVSDSAMVEYDGVFWRKIDVGMGDVRSLAMDDAGRVWVGGAGGFGYLAPDAKGAQSYVSLLDKVPEKDRDFTVWHSPAGSRFQALSMVRGHIYTDENGIGLEEIVGDELRPVSGGDAYANSNKVFLHPYDDGRIIVSERDGLLSLYDGQRSRRFALRRRVPEGSQTVHIHPAAGRQSLPHDA